MNLFDVIAQAHAEVRGEKFREGRRAREIAAPDPSPVVAPSISVRHFNHQETQVTVTSIETNDAKAAIAKARREIAEENLNKGVSKLKTKLRERDSAATILSNIDREIAELELSINQGNV